MAATCALAAAYCPALAEPAEQFLPLSGALGLGSRLPWNCGAPHPKIHFRLATNAPTPAPTAAHTGPRHRSPSFCSYTNCKCNSWNGWRAQNSHVTVSSFQEDPPWDVFFSIFPPQCWLLRNRRQREQWTLARRNPAYFAPRSFDIP